MNPVVQEYLRIQREKENKTKEANKLWLLNSIELLQKIPVSQNEITHKTLYTEDKDGNRSYFRYNIPDLSDEEYDELLRYAYPKKGINGVFLTLMVAAIAVYALSFLIGLIAGHAFRYDFGGSSSSTFYIGITIMVWIVGFVQGTVLLGIAEAVKLLHRINNKK